MNNDWIKLHRKIRNSTYYPKNKFTKFEAFIDILLMVRYSDGKQKFEDHFYYLKAGEMVTKQRILANRWGWSIGRVNKFIHDKGLKTQKVVNKKMNKEMNANLNKTITKVIVENWKDYQIEMNKEREHTNEQTNEPFLKKKGLKEEGSKSNIAVEKTFNYNEELEKMLKDEQRHIRLIAYYWKRQGIKFENEDQYKSSLKKYLKPASALKGYSREDIIKAMEAHESRNLTYTLHTIVKNIDEIKAGKWTTGKTNSTGKSELTRRRNV